MTCGLRKAAAIVTDVPLWTVSERNVFFQVTEDNLDILVSHTNTDFVLHLVNWCLVILQ